MEPGDRCFACRLSLVRVARAVDSHLASAANEKRGRTCKIKHDDSPLFSRALHDGTYEDHERIEKVRTIVRSKMAA